MTKACVSVPFPQPRLQFAVLIQLPTQLTGTQACVLQYVKLTVLSAKLQFVPPKDAGVVTT